MSNAFLDISLPEGVKGMPCHSGPRFSTRITLAKSGAEGRNQNWQNPLRKFQLPEAFTDDQAVFEELQDFWLIMAGPFRTWPFRDPFDFASAPLDEPNTEPMISGSDQPLFTADGLGYTYQIIKRRTLAGVNYDRPIYLPILDTLEFLFSSPLHGGLAPTLPASVGAPWGGPYTVGTTRPGGLVTVSPIPQAGLVGTCGYLFDTEVRWEADDSFDAVILSLSTTGSAQINLVEVRRC